jgi:hypothetical protein
MNFISLLTFSAVSLTLLLSGCGGGTADSPPISVAGVTFSPVAGVMTVNVKSTTPVAISPRGGTSPYHFAHDSLAYGAHPLGTALDLDGNLTGTPSQTGVFNFKVCVIDLVAASNCQMTSVTVNSATPAAATITANPGTVSMTFSVGSASTVSKTITITSSTPWTASDPGFGSLGAYGTFSVSPNSGPVGATPVTISYKTTGFGSENGFIRFRTTTIGVYAEVPVTVN